MRVAVGSTNPVKLKAVERIFRRAFGKAEVIGTEVDSGVPVQPTRVEEIIRGSINRARRAIRTLKADFGVGIEGGVARLGSRWYSFGFVAVIDGEGRVGAGSSGWFECPKGIVRELRKGKELGEVVDGLTGRRGTKYRGGAIGVFTRGGVSRRLLYEHAVWMALCRFLSPEFFE